MEGLLEKVFSEYGLALAALVSWIALLIKDRAAERAERQNNLTVFVDTVTKQTDALQTNTKAVSELQSALAVVAAILQKGKSGGE